MSRRKTRGNPRKRWGDSLGAIVTTGALAVGALWLGGSGLLGKIKLPTVSAAESPSSWPKPTGPFASREQIDAMIAANPWMMNQAQQWSSQRRANNENPYDWQAFRSHETGIGAPDPGPLPWEGFGEPVAG